MDSNHVAAVCEQYAELIDEACAAITDISPVPARMPEILTRVTMAGTLPSVLHLQHLLFMTHEIPKLMAEGRVEKAMRWLGWLQGACWGLGLESLEDAKKRNMPEGAAYDRNA